MLINKNLITLHLDSRTKEETIRKMAQMAADEGRVVNIEDYVKAVLRREEEYSTAVGFGVAIPHGKTDAVKEPLLAFARVNNIEWGAPDGKPVNMVFLIGVPESQAGTEHLKILANISRKLMKQEFRDSLNNAKTPEDILNVLGEV
ncbi:PTS sugar transporter subunit IIA [Defluviitalea raffinosedens]|uniref:PTS mannose transporter subunit IIAB n=1 Tax=Defluviitalea raffinosedens TaxID=1450156 RepID=A0A7C8LD45_9FIRM|nr:PTS sugar transporter subunit IIA [Defluviitalea raffinosedens]KAE9635465.1 PTS mannose transporter subunit IIAB [Defluviitalea raffinosedens]MBM7684372.1 PTS system fructose-specific IIA component [Defluviitalea raffinosedens]HHW67649.1 PTS transporter subunit EIIA [Candidatus Epulonipiscium sp.]